MHQSPPSKCTFLFFSPFSWILNQVWRGFYSLVVVLCWRKTTCTIAAKTKHKLGRSESLIQNHIKRKRRYLLKRGAAMLNQGETLALFYTIIDMQEWAAQGKRGARGLGSAVVETQNFLLLLQGLHFMFFLQQLWVLSFKGRQDLAEGENKRCAGSGLTKACSHLNFIEWSPARGLVLQLANIDYWIYLVREVVKKNGREVVKKTVFLRSGWP